MKNVSVNGQPVATLAELKKLVRLGDGVKLGEWVTLGNDVTLGDGVRVGNGVELGNDVTLGDGVRVGNDVTLGDGVRVGNGVELGNGVKLGDGFIANDIERLTEEITDRSEPALQGQDRLVVRFMGSVKESRCYTLYQYRVTSVSRLDRNQLIGIVRPFSGVNGGEIQSVVETAGHPSVFQYDFVVGVDSSD
jgi:acetyltransferase-like isoleucine patch superfamily enzyme